MPSTNHLFSDGVPRHDCGSMRRFGESHSNLVLQLIADVLPIVSADVLHELLPRCSHLVCSCLVSVVKHIVSESTAESTLGCFAGTGVVLASSTTTSTSISVAASATAIASSASSTHDEGEYLLRDSLADVTIGLLLPTL